MQDFPTSVFLQTNYNVFQCSKQREDTRATCLFVFTHIRMYTYPCP